MTKNQGLILIVKKNLLIHKKEIFSKEKKPRQNRGFLFYAKNQIITKKMSTKINTQEREKLIQNVQFKLMLEQIKKIAKAAKEEIEKNK